MSENKGYGSEQVKQIIGQWLDIKHKFERNFFQPPNSADVDHSALLARLLEGKDPLPLPPPRRYSYPDYELGEGKPVRVNESSPSVESPDVWVIDQSAWEVVEEDGDFLVLAWPETGEFYVFNRDYNILQKQQNNTHETAMKFIRGAIADDKMASSFQSLGQFRSAMLRLIDEIIEEVEEDAK